MASKRTLIVATISLFCLSWSTSTVGLDLSKHVAIANDSMIGFNGDPQAIKSAESSSKIGLVKAEEKTYVHYAGCQSEAILWHGVRAGITTWDIADVKPYSSSGAYITAISETNTGREMIVAGVHVYPSIYRGDNRLHFYTYWTSTGSNSSRGCYNDYCNGFVVAKEANTFPGQVLAPPQSTYGGEQRGIVIRIKKDEKTGDWSLYREDLGGPIGGMTLLGWWPSSLFNKLSENANIIQWSGIARHKYGELSPPMGSGHFSSELDGKAAAFLDCFGFDTNGDVFKGFYDPISIQKKQDCYTISDWYQTRHEEGRHFFFGGPGGCSR